MSMQDDIFDLDDFFKKLVKKDKKNKPYQDAWNRVYEWGCECENDNEKLRPIVNGMRNAISAMFEKEEG